jgi:undecaprenyl-diphosphatase
MPRSTSFPSGHSAAAFAFATGACAELPVLAPVLAPLAGTVAYSRVHIGVHYPSDVAAGAAIGIGSGLLAKRLPPGVLQRRRAAYRRADLLA